MFKRAVITFTELALWFVVLAMLVSGCTQSAASKPTESRR